MKPIKITYTKMFINELGNEKKLDVLTNSYNLIFGLYQYIYYLIF